MPDWEKIAREAIALLTELRGCCELNMDDGIDPGTIELLCRVDAFTTFNDVEANEFGDEDRFGEYANAVDQILTSRGQATTDNKEWNDAADAQDAGWTPEQYANHLITQRGAITPV